MVLYSQEVIILKFRNSDGRKAPTLSNIGQVPVAKTYSDDVSCCVLAVRLVVLLRGVRLLQGLQFQLRGQEGAEIWDGARACCDH